MLKSKMSIIDFFEDPAILNFQELSPAQKVILKIIFNEELDATTPIQNTHEYQELDKPGGFANEVELFKFLTGKEEYIPGKQYYDASICAGRRGGKSNVIGAGIALYKATQYDYKPYLRTSPFATIPIISPTKEQANEVYSAIKNFIMQSPYLFQMFLDGKLDGFSEQYNEDSLGDDVTLSGRQIRLNNKVVVKVLTADVSNIRGFATPFNILDEACWFGTDASDSKNTDKGIAQAIEPATAQFEDIAFSLRISSPNGETGLMYEDYLNRNEEDILHFQVPTWWMNPTISVAYLEKQKKKGIAYFNREYGAVYSASEHSYLDPNLIDNTLLRGVEKLEHNRQYRYVAAMDYATKGDYWTLAIGHKEYQTDNEGIKKEHVYIDYLHHWRGTQGDELKPDEIVAEISLKLKEYNVSYILTDQYAFAALKVLFQREQALAKEFKVSTQSKLKYMYSLQVAVNSGILKMINKPLAVKHLKDLREKRTASGKIKVEHAANSNDDYADVIALCVYQFDKTSPVYVGMHRVEDDEPGVSTRDARGKFIATPLASELANITGNTNFRDNSQEVADRLKKERGEDDDDDNGSGGLFWSF